MLDKQPATPTLGPIILPDMEVLSSYVCIPELHHTASPPVLLQPIKDPATEEKEVMCDVMSWVLFEYKLLHDKFVAYSFITSCMPLK